MMGMPPLPSSETPKLKDFLPFMKPNSFGPKAAVGSQPSTVSNDCAPGSAGSLPASVSASPVHLPQAPVSFPPSPQRQPPMSTSNGYGETSQRAASGFVHADAGYPVAEALLSPTAPPGAPRSASPAHQQLPAATAHPGGPGESHHLPSRPLNMSYNFPQSSGSQSSSAVGIGVPPVASHLSSAQGDVQAVGQSPATAVYSRPAPSQPGMAMPGIHPHYAPPSNTSSFPNHIPGQPMVSNATGAVNMPSDSNSRSQHGGYPYATAASIGATGVAANWHQSYSGGTVTAGGIQQPNLGTAIPGVPVQANNSNNVPPPLSSVGGNQMANSELPGRQMIPSVVPPACASNTAQLSYQAVQPGGPQPPSYQAVTQHFPPPNQAMQPVFGGARAQAGYPPAGTVAAMPASYHAVSVGPADVSCGSMQAAYLPAGTGNQPMVTSMHPQHSSVSQPPAPMQTVPGSTSHPYPAGLQQMQLSYQQQQQPVVSDLQPKPHMVAGGMQPTVPSQRSLATSTAPQHPVMPANAAQPQPIGYSQPRHPHPVSGPLPPQPDQHQFAPSQVPVQQHPAGAAMPVAQPQPRYPPVPATASHPYPAGLQPTYQNTSQHTAPSGMQQIHASAGHVQAAVPNQHPQYQQQPVRPNQPEAVGYLPGNPPQVRYPTSNQVFQPPRAPTPVYPQPSAVSSQPMPMQYQPQQQAAYHPGSSQPLPVNQSSTLSYSHGVNNAPGEMQAFADIPVCLPSPLQPSRVTTAEVSKNVDSLRDLDLSGKTSVGDAQPKQKDSSENLPDVEAAESKSAASSSAAVSADVDREQGSSEEEARRSLHQSRSSRDVFADADTLTRFVAEVEKFQKHVDSLVKPTLGGYFPLDKEWKVSFVFALLSVVLYCVKMMTVSALYASRRC